MYNIILYNHPTTPSILYPLGCGWLKSQTLAPKAWATSSATYLLVMGQFGWTVHLEAWQGMFTGPGIFMTTLAIRNYEAPAERASVGNRELRRPQTLQIEHSLAHELNFRAHVGDKRMQRMCSQGWPKVHKGTPRQGGRNVCQGGLRAIRLPPLCRQVRGPKTQ